MTPHLPPPPKPLPTPEFSEPFCCPICDKDISADRQPNLNLDNCSCGESGTSFNDPREEETSLHTQSNQERKAMALETMQASINNQDKLKDVKETYEQLETLKKREDQGLPTNQEAHNCLPSFPNESMHLSFAMTAYLAAISPEKRSYHEALDLDFDLDHKFSNMFDNPPTTSNFSLPTSPTPQEFTDLSLSLLLITQPSYQPNPLTASACATKASGSMRSSWSSLGSWGSQTRSFGSDMLVWTGGWQEDITPLEMSWPPVLCENLFFTDV